MHRIVTLSKRRHVKALQGASSIAPEVKLTFARDVIDVAIPLFVNKDATNPDPDPDTGGGGGDTT